MAWWETDRVIQRKKFIMEWLSGDFTVTELSVRHDISRDKLYKWLRRYQELGPNGLEDRSHRPHFCPHATPGYILEEAVCLRTSRRVPMGAGKVRTRLLTEHPDWPVPSERTLHNHFTKLDLVPKPRRHSKSAHPGRPTAPFTGPNSIWSADFKGDFKTRNGWRCYPLTIQDGFSRYLLECQGLDGTRLADTKRVFTRVFREFGLPERIRTDNGVPFSSPHSLARLSQLSVWWIRLGILPDLIEPASPYQNGRHERMHRDLKAETTIPPAGVAPLSSAASTSSAAITTTSGHTRLSARSHPPPSMNPRSGLSPTSSHPSSTPPTSRHVKSLPTEASDGTRHGSTSRSSSAVSVSASRRSPAVSGLSTSDPCFSAGFT